MLYEIVALVKRRARMQTQVKNRNLTITLFITIIVFFVLTTGCNSSSSSNPGTTSSHTSSGNDNKSEALPDACQLIDKSILEKALGAPIVHSEQVLNQTGSSSSPAMAQCTHYAGNGSDMRYIGIVIRKLPPKQSNPTSREEYMKSMNEGLMIGPEEEVKTAISKGSLHPGPGDLAFSFNYISQNLVVCWKGHYMAIISLSGRKDTAGVVEDEKAIATAIIEKLQ